MKFIFSLLLISCANLSLAQSAYPVEYFGAPLDVPMVLAGTFGELRSDHFHAGMDIKTQQREGLSVFSAAEGYVSRINISNYGYGKALYIKHPNGYTTVYAHLSELSPRLETYIKKLQYEQESYEIEVFPEPAELAVDKGELIAYSGNTGGSGGPHLHFEIRDEYQRPMNPMLFGYEVADSRTPIVRSVFVYPLDENSHANNSSRRQKLQLSRQSDGSYRAQPLEAFGKIGFGVSTVDQLDGAYNRNGVYRIEAIVNGDKVFQANFEKFSFAETRHLNKLIDYEYYSEHRDRIQKLFVKESNPLSIYSNLHNRGVLQVKDSLSYNYIIRISDYAGNERVIRIPVEGEAVENILPKEEIITKYFVPADQNVVFEKNGIDIYIPKNSLYEDAYLDIQFEDEKVSLHKDVIPLNSSISIGFDVSKYKPEDREQMYIARLSDYGTPYYSSTEKKEDRFVTRTRNFGVFTLARDTNPPSIDPHNFRDEQWVSFHENLKVEISDSETGIQGYRATINGEFILMEYEYKDNMLTYDFEDNVSTETENKFKLEVIDNVGNTAVFESTFYRKDEATKNQ